MVKFSVYLNRRVFLICRSVSLGRAVSLDISTAYAFMDIAEEWKSFFGFSLRKYHLNWHPENT